MANNWIAVTTSAPSFELLGAEVGQYEFEVVSVGVTGSTTDASVLSTTESGSGSSATPPNITGLQATPINEFLLSISWNSSTDSTIVSGASVIVNHQPVLSGAAWGNSTTLATVTADQNSAIVPLLTGTYLLKYSSSGRVRSVTAASIVIRKPYPKLTYTVLDARESLTGFSGAKIGTSFNVDYGGLTLGVSTTFDELAPGGDFDSVANLETSGTALASGEYLFANPIDLNSIYSVRLERLVDISTSNTANVIDENYGNIDTWVSFDGGASTTDSDCNAILYARASNDAPAANTWGDWFVVTNNSYVARSFEFKVVLASLQANQNPVLTEAGVIVSLEQNTEFSGVTSSPTTIDENNALVDTWADFDVNTLYTCVFSTGFYLAPTVNVTPFNMQTGDYFTISNVTATGFELDFFASGGTPVTRQFSYSAVGYGKRF